MNFDQFAQQAEAIIGYKPSKIIGISNIARIMDGCIFLGGPNFERIDGTKQNAFCSRISFSPTSHLFFCLNFGKSSTKLAAAVQDLDQQRINNCKILLDDKGLFISTSAEVNTGKYAFNTNEDIRISAESFIYNVEGSGKTVQETLSWIKEHFPGTLLPVGKSGSLNNLLPKTNSSTHSLNKILYGPPGTGKTYNAINHAVAIIENISVEEIIENEKADPLYRKKIKKKFDEFVNQGRIQFVTFHQSYSYEEFVEGLKAKVNEDDQVYYEIEDGVFKKLCTHAQRSQYLTVEISGNKKELTRELFEEIYYEFSIKLPEQTEPTSQIKINTKEGYEFSLFRNSNDSIVVKAGKWKNPMSQSCNELTKILFDNKAPTYKSYSDKIIEKIFEGKKLEKKEINNNDRPFVLIIDEINRGNISKIFGELITLIEDSKRKGRDEELTTKLTYSGSEENTELFGVPDNIYIIGTMNTADKSIALVDLALRRRFSFIEHTATPELLGTTEDGIDLKELLTKMNERIEFLLDRDHLLGHAYFSNIKTKNELCDLFRNKIIPLLQEYFYNDFNKISMVLGDHKEWKKDEMLFLIKPKKHLKSQSLFGKQLEDEFDGKEEKLFMLNEDLQRGNYDDITDASFITIYNKDYKKAVTEPKKADEE